MKIKIEEEKTFKPIEIKLTLETKEEVENFKRLCLSFKTMWIYNNMSFKTSIDFLERLSSLMNYVRSKI